MTDRVISLLSDRGPAMTVSEPAKQNTRKNSEHNYIQSLARLRAFGRQNQQQWATRKPAGIEPAAVI